MLWQPKRQPQIFGVIRVIGVKRSSYRRVGCPRRLGLGVGVVTWPDPGMNSDRLTRSGCPAERSAGGFQGSGTHRRAGLIAWPGKRPGFRRADGQRVRAIPQPDRKSGIDLRSDCGIIGGVDPLADAHVAAVIDPIGGRHGVEGFPAPRLMACGGLAGRVRDRVPAGRGDRQRRRRPGPATSQPPASGSSKWIGPTGRTGAVRASPTRSMPVGAARAAQSGRVPVRRGRHGAVEAIRALMVAKRSAAGERTRTINQARALIVPGPDDLRTRTQHTAASLVAGLSSLRPRPGDVVGMPPGRAAEQDGARAPGRPAQRLDAAHRPPVTARAPGLLPSTGSGRTCGAVAHRRGRSPWTAPLRGRLGAPVRHRPHPGIVGQSVRHRLHPGGDRQANHALWRIVITRLGSARPPAPTLNAAPQTENPGRDHPLPQALPRPRGLPHTDDRRGRRIDPGVSQAHCPVAPLLARNSNTSAAVTSTGSRSPRRTPSNRRPPPAACSAGTGPPRTPDTGPPAGHPSDTGPGQTPTPNAQNTGSCSSQHHPGA